MKNQVMSTKIFIKIIEIIVANPRQVGIIIV